MLNIEQRRFIFLSYCKRDLTISIFEILSSGDIGQSTNTEIFPTLYGIYMKVHPREPEKALRQKNASEANVLFKENAFIYIGEYNNAFTQKRENCTDTGVNSFYVLFHCHIRKPTPYHFIWNDTTSEVIVLSSP